MMLGQIKIYYDFSKKSSYFSPIPSTLFLGKNAMQERRNEIVQGKPTVSFFFFRAI